MDETELLLQQYENVLGLYKHTNEIRQSRINWGLGLETALLAALGAFGEHLAVAVAASAAGIALAVALLFIAGRHSAYMHLAGAQLRAIERRLQRLGDGKPNLTALWAEKALFGLPDTGWLQRALSTFGARSIRLAETNERVRLGLTSRLSANWMEQALMLVILVGWLVLLVLLTGGWLDIGGDRW